MVVRQTKEKLRWAASRVWRHPALIGFAGAVASLPPRFCVASLDPPEWLAAGQLQG